ncbi:MAG TPA: Ig-like domain-containing protein [Longimicrobium sp.]|nr:Ig-like domain-containing protein [Longimicrobium sp.]
MKRLFLLTAAALLALPACKGESTGPADVASVTLLPDGRTLAPGETLALEAVVRDEDGNLPRESVLSDLEWSTSAPAVATVSQAGIVTAVGAGTAVITAELDGKSGTVEIAVAAAPTACTVRSLGVGESLTLGGAQASLFCLDGAATGKEYVAVPFHGGDTAAGTASVSFTTQGTIPVLATSPSLAPGSLGAAAGPRPDEEFHIRLRNRTEQAVRRYVPAAHAVDDGAGIGPRMVLNLASPTVGQQVQVNVSIEPCDDADMRTGRVAAVGTRSIVLTDVNNPAGGFSDAEYASLAMTFDTLIHPLVTANFGDPGDVDGNGRAVIFYTRAVNELSTPGSGSYVGGFFHARDLFPTRSRDNLEGCEASNFAEMFYMLVPDPNGAVNNNRFSRDFVAATTLGTLAHEYQHLVSASRRLYNLETEFWNESTWLNEGLSHIAEELAFYRASGYAPRQNLNRANVDASTRAQVAFLRYMEQNYRRLERWLQNPETQSPYDVDDDLGTRGAAWAFLRYAADRRAGTETELWRGLIDSPLTGFANLKNALGLDPRPWIRDWTAGMFADDVVPGLDARYQQPSWNYRLLYPGYPLVTRRLEVNGQASLVLNSGSGAFVRFGVAPGGTGTIRAGSGISTPFPSKMFVTVIRTK